MSSDETCNSSAYRDDQLVHCTRDRGHPSVHLGRLTIGEHADELVQWNDAEALRDDEPASEMPVWYHALPVGKGVHISYRDALDALDGELVGAVLDDHEQPAALVVEQEDARRVLVPWHNVAAMSWEPDDE